MHCGTLQAATDCVLLELMSPQFRAIVAPFPTAHARTYAASFLRSLNDCDREELTDLPSDSVDRGMHAAFPEVYDAAQAAEGRFSFNVMMSGLAGKSVSKAPRTTAWH